MSAATVQQPETDFDWQPVGEVLAALGARLGPSEEEARALLQRHGRNAGAVGFLAGKVGEIYQIGLGFALMQTGIALLPTARTTFFVFAFVSGSATVVYDETVIDLKAIKARVHKCGYHCSGELVPKHLCKPGNPPSEG